MKLAASRRTGASLVLLAATAWHAAAPAGAAEPAYPSRPIRIIVGFAPGGAADIFARMVGQKLTDAWGQPVVVDNRPGAGSTIGSDIAAKSAPDGYSITLISASYATSAGLYEKVIKYHPVDSFSPVVLIGVGGNALLVHPTVAARTTAEFLAAARTAPEKFALGSAGTGSITHLASELLASMAGIRLRHIPYKGGGPNMTALLSGEIQVTVASVPASIPGVKSGRVRALGVTTARRSPALPEVPTIAESGLPGYEAANWWGILAPAGTPARVVSRLNGEMNAVLRTAEFTTALAREGAEPGGGAPEAMGRFLRAEIAKWTKVIRDAGVKLQ